MADQNNQNGNQAAAQGSGENTGSQSAQNGNQQASQPAQQTAPAVSIDYEKLSKMLSGTLEAKEDTALKAYFRQQGMTQEEMTQAIAAFKEQRAKNTPDPAALQDQLQKANAKIMQMQIEQAVSQEAAKLGIDPNTIPYVMKLADLTQVVGSDGKLIPEKITEALNKVLTDLPALKPTNTGAAGFQQVGTHNAQSAGSGGQNSGQSRSKEAIAQKRWNRTNH